MTINEKDFDEEFHGKDPQLEEIENNPDRCNYCNGWIRRRVYPRSSFCNMKCRNAFNRKKQNETKNM